MEINDYKQIIQSIDQKLKEMEKKATDLTPFLVESQKKVDALLNENKDILAVSSFILKEMENNPDEMCFFLLNYVIHSHFLMHIMGIASVTENKNKMAH